MSEIVDKPQCRAAADSGMTVPARTKPSRRAVWFRVGVVLAGFSVFVVAEVLCLAFDWGRPTEFDDPFVGFSAVRPLFVLDDDGQRYSIPKSRRGFFAAESFPAKKPPGVFRIFCLGGSTVQGRPYSKETSFTTWLQLALKAADPRSDWEVVNCGGISYASYRLVPILKECLNYEPDLFILCTGHNEFLEERSYGHIKQAPPLLLSANEFVSRFRTYWLFRQALLAAVKGSSRRERTDRKVLNAEADALLDYRNGLKAYHRDDEFQAGVAEHFEFNLRHMLVTARNAGVPAMLVLPPSNLSDCPPFKSQHDERLTEQQLQEWQQLWEQAKSLYRNDLPESIAALWQAIHIDDKYAAAFYELGKCYESLRQFDAAREAFLRARDLDVCPLRMPAPIAHAITVVARDSRTPLLDAHELLERDCPSGILGNSQLVDHVHPSFEGHQKIALSLVRELESLGLIEPTANWEPAAWERFRQHFDSLSDFYFLSGRRTLEAVRGWTQGRAAGPPLESRASRGSQP